MSFRAALNVEEDEAEIMKRNGNETGWCPAEGETAGGFRSLWFLAW